MNGILKYLWFSGRSDADEAILPAFRMGSKKSYWPDELEGHLVDIKLVVRRYNCGHATITPCVMGTSDSPLECDTLPIILVVKTSKSSKFMKVDDSRGIVINTEYGWVRGLNPDEDLSDEDRAIPESIVHLPGTDPAGAMLMFVSQWTTWESWNGAGPAIPDGWIAAGHWGENVVKVVVGCPITFKDEDVFFHPRPHECPRCREEMIIEEEESEAA